MYSSYGLVQMGAGWNDIGSSAAPKNISSSGASINSPGGVSKIESSHKWGGDSLIAVAKLENLLPLPNKDIAMVSDKKCIPN